jgi:hypothetical protein
LSTSKVTISEVNTELPGLDLLLIQKQRLRKLCRKPACKTAVNWVTNAIRRMTRRRALERWETKIANADGPFGLTFHSVDKANATADCLENQFTLQDLGVENHKRQVEARVQTLLEAIGNNSPERIRPCDLQKLVDSLKLRKAYRTDCIPNECLRKCQADLWYN